MEELTIRALYVEPGKQPVVRELMNQESEMEDLVHGKIASVGIDEDVTVIYNAFSEVLNMPYCRTIYNRKFYGPFVICEYNQYGQLHSLGQDNLQYYRDMFALAE